MVHFAVPCKTIANAGIMIRTSTRLRWYHTQEIPQTILKALHLPLSRSERKEENSQHPQVTHSRMHNTSTHINRRIVARRHWLAPLFEPSGSSGRRAAKCTFKRGVVCHHAKRLVVDRIRNCGRRDPLSRCLHLSCHVVDTKLMPTPMLRRRPRMRHTCRHCRDATTTDISSADVYLHALSTGNFALDTLAERSTYTKPVSSLSRSE
jgi:hypothetical protein